MGLTRMVTSRRWRRVPRATAGTAAVVLLAGLACGAVTGSSAPAARSHAATAVRRALDAAAVKYHGVIGAPSSALETGAQIPAPPPVNVPAYHACVNPQGYIDNPQGYAGKWQQASAYLAGWSNVSKLGGSAVIGSPVLGLAGGNSGNQPNAGEGVASANNLVLGKNGQPEGLYDCGMAKLNLDSHGQRSFPPLTATFLAYGFVPVTATVYLTQAGPAPVTTLAFAETQNGAGTASFLPQSNTVVSTSRVTLRLADVKVNGVPLDVGPGCRTTGPVASPSSPLYDPANPQLVLTGGNIPGDPAPFFNNIFAGGALAGVATIPPFTGCVTPGGDNLDALLDSSVSGPGNYVEVYVGLLCFNAVPVTTAGGQCSPATSPATLPQYAPVWTVANGGDFSASSPVTIQPTLPAPVATGGGIPQWAIPAFQIGCTGSRIEANIADNPGGPPRSSAFGSVTWTSFSGCGGIRFNCKNPGGQRSGNCSQSNVESNPDGSTWTIRQQGKSYLVGYKYINGVTQADIDNVVLILTGANVPVYPGSSTIVSCTAELAGTITNANANDITAGGNYTNSSSVLAVGNQPQVGNDVINFATNLSVAQSTCPISTGLVPNDGVPRSAPPGERGLVVSNGPTFYATYRLPGLTITNP